MREPFISVIIPVYNAEKYLHKGLDSVINHTYNNLEIILIDDGSTDKSSEICDEYASKDSRIIVKHKENGGVSSARNAALDLIKGEYVAFVDSDDYVEPDYIEYLYRLIYDSNANISCCQFSMFDENGNQKRIPNKQEKNVIIGNEECFRYLIYNDDNYSWGKLFETRLFKHIRYRGKSFDDTLTVYKIFAKCEKLVIGEKVKYNYLYRKNSICHSIDIQKMERIIGYIEHRDFIVNNFPQMKGFAERKIIKTCNWLLRKIIINKHQPISLIENKSDFKDGKNLLQKTYRNYYKNYISIKGISLREKLFTFCAAISLVLTIRIYRMKYHIVSRINFSTIL